MLLRKILLWAVAFILTLGSLYYQRKTGPTYPLDGEAEFAGTVVTYSLGRSNRGLGHQEVSVNAPNPDITARLMYKRYKTNDQWTEVMMVRKADNLTGWMPEQPPAGKLEYYVELMAPGAKGTIPEKETVITRHTGHVPDIILYPHIVCMFLAFLLAIRAGLETFFSDGRPRALAHWTLFLIFIGGFILGMLVQHFAFGPYWTGIPFGWDLTDNKTLVALIAWAVAVIVTWNKGNLMHQPGRKWFILGATIVTMIVYMIPHSVMGSELDYSKQNSTKPVTMRLE